MRVARSEKLIAHRQARSLFQRSQQGRRRLRKLVFKKISGTQRKTEGSHSVPGAEAQRRLEMLDCKIRLAGEIPQSGAPHPTSGKAGIEGERAVDRTDRDIDVLSKRSEHYSSIGEDIGVIRGTAERLPCQINAFATVGLCIVCPVAGREELMTQRR